MEIKTRFGIGDVAYYVNGSELKKLSIARVGTNSTPRVVIVLYEGTKGESKYEEELFSGRQEFLDSFNKQFDIYEKPKGKTK